MTTEEKIKEIIINEYGSIREFSMKIAMPYSTIDSIFKRGINNASINNIIKICDELNLSVDALSSGNIVYKRDIQIDNSASQDNKQLQTLLDCYYAMNETGREALLAAAQGMRATYETDTKNQKSSAG